MNTYDLARKTVSETHEPFVKICAKLVTMYGIPDGDGSEVFVPVEKAGSRKIIDRGDHFRIRELGPNLFSAVIYKEKRDWNVLVNGRIPIPSELERIAIILEQIVAHLSDIDWQEVSFTGRLEQTYQKLINHLADQDVQVVR